MIVRPPVRFLIIIKTFSKKRPNSSTEKLVAAGRFKSRLDRAVLGDVRDE